MYEKYLLITSAFNEEKNIEKTINSVITQSVKPVKWFIINDGSTDKTQEIISQNTNKYDFIDLINIPANKKHHSFGSKVRAINTGLESITTEIKYNFIGILDADLSFEKNYYEEILNKFKDDKSLGIAGGDVVEYVNGKYNKRIKTYNSVAGGVQLFRRECFQELTGFQPFEYGGEDAAMEIEARMLNWKVQTYPGIQVIHHGYVGGGSGNILRSRCRRGAMYRYIGYHPLFHVIRCIYRLFEKPYLTGSISEIYGYFIYYFKGNKIMVSDDVLNYLRKEQVQRLKKIFIPFI